ncbi:MAG: zinc-binding alcohol dehydrogenase family protein, partial [Acidimicrobiales bacterium]
DGELEPHGLPRILGHQIVGIVLAAGPESPPDAPPPGSRVGIPWLGWTCGVCRYCRSGRENLCRRARFTGRDLDGGFAERTVADARYCLPLPSGPSAVELAPLLCGGLIGYRALRLAGDANRLGLYGFGSSAHQIAQVARFQGRRVFAFTRAGDDGAQSLASELGAEWVGASDVLPPEELDGAIVFASAGELVPAALRALAPGGTVVCAGIHMTDIPSFPYADLWKERVIRSVANLTREDGRQLLELAPQVPIRTHVRRYALEDAEQALADLRAGAITGSAVIDMSQGTAS